MRLVLYEPKIEDLWFREQMLADSATMSYNERWGWTIAFSPEKWGAWHGTWTGDENNRFYRYLLGQSPAAWALRS